MDKEDKEKLESYTNKLSELWEKENEIQSMMDEMFVKFGKENFKKFVGKYYIDEYRLEDIDSISRLKTMVHVTGIKSVSHLSCVFYCKEIHLVYTKNTKTDEEIVEKSEVRSGTFTVNINKRTLGFEGDVIKYRESDRNAWNEIKKEFESNLNKI